MRNKWYLDSSTAIAKKNRDQYENQHCIECTPRHILQCHYLSQNQINKWEYNQEGGQTRHLTYLIYFILFILSLMLTITEKILFKIANSIKMLIDINTLVK